MGARFYPVPFRLMALFFTEMWWSRVGNGGTVVNRLERIVNAAKSMEQGGGYRDCKKMDRSGRIPRVYY